MATRCGIDIVEIKRFKRWLQRSAVEQMQQVFTVAEWTHCHEKQNPIQSLAARFAIKEACMKLFPAETTRSKLDFIEIEVAIDNDGAPYVNLGKKLQELLQIYALTRISISISHTQSYACGIAIAE